MQQERKRQSMNWVAPIKDEKTFKDFEERLRMMGSKYYIMFEIGVGTGLQLQDVLKLRVRDVKDKEFLEVFIGTRRVRRGFRFSDELREAIAAYTADMDPDGYLIVGHAGSKTPLSREQAYRALRHAGASIGLTSIGAQTMRKTFAWRYYHATGDIYYLQNLLNHASAAITYRYIGEEPVDPGQVKSFTRADPAQSRRELLCQEGGKKRIGQISAFLEKVNARLEDDLDDETCSRIYSMLLEMEDAVSNYEEGRR